MSANQPPQRKRGKRQQSFLRSKDAYTLDLREISAMNEEEAFQRFVELRYAATGGKPVCPGCEMVATNTIRRWNPKRSICRTIFKCKGCHKHFTATSNTVLAYHKMSFCDLLLTIALFVHKPKGTPALEIVSWLKCDYRAAMLLLHKLREAMARDAEQDARPFEGEVEADTTWVGGSLRPKNLRAEIDGSRPDAVKQNPWKYPYRGRNKKNVTVLLERGAHGRVFAGVADKERESPTFIEPRVTKATTLITDQAGVYQKLGWNVKEHLTVNHSLCFWTGEANTNTAESFFSVMRRAEIGVYHHISHPAFVESYIKERAWRFQYRRVSTGEKFNALLRAVGLRGRSKYAGMWQRGRAVA